MNESILSLIGNTPLIKLNRLFDKSHFQFFAKLETYNPGGSMKDRVAIQMVQAARERGEIGRGTTIIESSSGNLGIGLAQTCAYWGLRFICVIDSKTTKQNRSILKSYGAEIDLVDKPDPVTGEYLEARIQRVKYLLQTVSDSYWPNQYANLDNPRAHHKTMEEISIALDGKVDYLFCSTSTCGTIRGCAEYIKERGLPTTVVAVDAIGSVIFGCKAAKRLIPGHGAARMPELHQPDLIDRCVHVSDLDCIVGCRRLVLSEAILAGGSSGAVVRGVENFKDDITPGSNCVAILADRGERYQDTIFSDTWVTEHFGDVSHLWNNPNQHETRAVAAAY